MTILTPEQEKAFAEIAKERERIIEVLSKQVCHSFNINLMPEQDQLKLLETIQNFYKKRT